MKKKRIKRIKCPYCEKDYANENTLAIHIQSVHPEKIKEIDDNPSNKTIKVILKDEPIITPEKEEKLLENAKTNLPTISGDTIIEQINPEIPDWYKKLEIFANNFKTGGRVSRDQIPFVTRMYRLLTGKPPLSTSCSKTVIQMALVISTNFFKIQEPKYNSL